MERALHSQTIGEIAKALSTAQRGMEHAAKTAQNPHFKSTYATLADCIDAARDSLTANGLAVTQHVTHDELGNPELVTMLIHASGEWMRSFYPLRPLRQDPQSFAGAVTYARRYSYCAMLGVAPVEDDDDGNAAAGRDNRPVAHPLPPRVVRASGNGNGAHKPVTEAVAPPEDPGAVVFDAVDRDGMPVSKRYHRRTLTEINRADPSVLPRLLDSPKYARAIPADLQMAMRAYLLRLERDRIALNQEPAEPDSDMHFELED